MCNSDFFPQNNENKNVSCRIKSCNYLLNFTETGVKAAGNTDLHHMNKSDKLYLIIYSNRKQLFKL